MKKILLVDDEEDVLFALGNILRRHNYEVVATTLGREAIELAKTTAPDLIILDVLLPDKDGAEVAFALEQDTLTKNIPIVFLTGILTKAEEVPGKKTGTHYTIAKPIIADELLDIIAKVLPS